MRIAHLILGLGSGGAEQMLLKLSTEFSKDTSVNQLVFTISNIDFLLPKFKEKKIKVIMLKGKSHISSVFILPKLIYYLYKLNPNVLQCWMYHAEFLGLLSKIFYWRKFKLFWNIRRSSIDWQEGSLIYKIIFKILAMYSNVPDGIFSNTDKGIINHLNAGYKSQRMIKIGNGFDFTLNPSLILNKEFIFKKYNIPLNSRTIVMVARFNFVKDHITLIKAYDKFLEDSNYSDVKLILIGNNDNNEIKDQICNSKNSKNIFLLGNMYNVIEVISNFDVGVLTSIHEGFPNVIGEYIMSNLLVVATDVGEVRNIIKQSPPFLTKPKDFIALSNYLKIAFNLSEEEKNEILEENKRHIKEQFSINIIKKKYLEEYKK